MGLRSSWLKNRELVGFVSSMVTLPASTNRSDPQLNDARPGARLSPQRALPDQLEISALYGSSPLRV